MKIFLFLGIQPIFRAISVLQGLPKIPQFAAQISIANLLCMD